MKGLLGIQHRSNAIKAFTPVLRSLSSVVMISTITIASASAAGNYYNCAVTTGCEKIGSRSSASQYTKTKYPIVLAHGLTGWNQTFKSVDYFYGIPEALMKGGSQVFSTKVSSINNSEVRGEQLLRQVRTIAAISGTKKVNIIGHSQGGMDARYVAGVAPQYVASVTAVASPVQGSKVADWASKRILQSGVVKSDIESDVSLASKVIVNLSDLVGLNVNISSDIDVKSVQLQVGWEALNGLTTAYSKTFNAKFPAAVPTAYCKQPNESTVDGINYYSFSGKRLGTNIFDMTDSAVFAAGNIFQGEASDGLVSVCSSRLGQVIRDDYEMNHLDSANQVLGLVSLSETNPISVYRSQVNRLKNSNL